MIDRQEQRHIYYDSDLDIEAYNLVGIVQKFPNHFHEYYVIGFIEGGKRHLWCKNQEYDLTEGDLILFNPKDNHYCAPVNGEILDYQAVNIKVEVMKKAAQEITGRDYFPYFTQNVVYQSDISLSLGSLYQSILNHRPRMEKEETFYFLLEQILKEYTKDFTELNLVKPDDVIRRLCEYMDSHYDENISLNGLSGMAGLSKYYLLRFFTRQIGVSPYRYLQTVRIHEAKKLLEQGVPPVEAAGRTGFSDQSHFSNFFKEFIGLTPRQYMKIFTDQVSTEHNTAEVSNE